jgi:hypothetical protein
MESSGNRCPLCGSETSTEAAQDPQAIRAQIQRLQEQLHRIEGGESEHPHTATGGYGADPTEA